MIRAFYSASSGMVAQTVKQDVITHNIANAQTPGFKRQKAIASSFEDVFNTQLIHIIQKERPDYPDSPLSAQKVNMESALDESQGPIRNTGNKTDVAIFGLGEFQVSVNGAMQTTRAGNFQTNSRNQLCTADGGLVMDEKNRAIEVPDNGPWTIGGDGTVKDSKGNEVAKIKIVGGDSNTSLKQGCLEEANVTVVREMVDMIANMRNFEANQKVITSVDSTLEKLINEVGKV